MQGQATVIASGNLASPRRTIAGVLGQLYLLDVPASRATMMLADTGLPSRALDEPDFPISLQQELIICQALVRSLGQRQSPVVSLFLALDRMGIEHLGVLGMAMRHAPNAVEALRVCLDYPQLTWGHSRMIVSRQAGAAVFTFTMERPSIPDATDMEVDRLVDYCLVLDLLSSLRNIGDIVESGQAPLAIHLPFAQPVDWNVAQDRLPCPVLFSRPEACLVYPAALDESPLPRANPVVFRSFLSVAEKLSRMLAQDISLRERVARWLWAYTPPLRRAELARQLGMSERNLTRQLRREKTSYADLLAEVQCERACNLLRSGALTVTEIAYRLGYAEPAAFSRAFTRWTGQAPTRWRRGKSGVIDNDAAAVQEGVDAVHHGGKQ